MLSNDLRALHEMARKIGLRRSWFQGDSRFAHYDVTASKRTRAVAEGAVEIGLGELPADILMRVEAGVYEKRYVVMARREQDA